MACFRSFLFVCANPHELHGTRPQRMRIDFNCKESTEELLDMKVGMKVGIISLIVLTVAFSVIPGWNAIKVDAGLETDCGRGENGGGSTVPESPQYPSTTIIDWMQRYPYDWLRYYHTCFPPLGETFFKVYDDLYNPNAYTTRTVNVNFHCPPSGVQPGSLAGWLRYRWGWTEETARWLCTGYKWDGGNAEYKIYSCPSCPK